MKGYNFDEFSVFGLSLVFSILFAASPAFALEAKIIDARCAEGEFAYAEVISSANYTTDALQQNADYCWTELDKFLDARQLLASQRECTKEGSVLRSHFTEQELREEVELHGSSFTCRKTITSYCCHTEPDQVLVNELPPPPLACPAGSQEAAAKLIEGAMLGNEASDARTRAITDYNNALNKFTTACQAINTEGSVESDPMSVRVDWEAQYGGNAVPWGYAYADALCCIPEQAEVPESDELTIDWWKQECPEGSSNVLSREEIGFGYSNDYNSCIQEATEQIKYQSEWFRSECSEKGADYRAVASDYQRTDLRESNNWGEAKCREVITLDCCSPPPTEDTCSDDSCSTDIEEEAVEDQEYVPVEPVEEPSDEQYEDTQTDSTLEPVDEYAYEEAVEETADDSEEYIETDRAEEPLEEPFEQEYTEPVDEPEAEYSYVAFVEEETPCEAVEGACAEALNGRFGDETCFDQDAYDAAMAQWTSHKEEMEFSSLDGCFNRSAAVEAQDLAVFSACDGISNIVDLRGGLAGIALLRHRNEGESVTENELQCEESGCVIYNYPIGVTPPCNTTRDVELMSLAMELITTSCANGDKVLVHCSEGRDRTGMMTGLYQRSAACQADPSAEGCRVEARDIYFDMKYNDPSMRSFGCLDAAWEAITGYDPDETDDPCWVDSDGAYLQAEAENPTADAEEEDGVVEKRAQELIKEMQKDAQTRATAKGIDCNFEEVEELGNAEDNCPNVENTAQLDTDFDGIGDACDSDIDGDGESNETDICPLDAMNECPENDSDGDGIIEMNDNCPATFNSDQLDTDNDSTGDACDDDIDGDGESNTSDVCPLDVMNYCPENDSDSDGMIEFDDNCPTVSNADQLDTDYDSVGDVCDDDIDGDGASNATDVCPLDPMDYCSANDSDGDGYIEMDDNCPFIYNPAQSDIDYDGTGDTCDEDIDGDGNPNATDICPQNSMDYCSANDTDADGYIGMDDNCPNVYNPDQSDMDWNGVGDACDDDIDGDANPNETDICPLDSMNYCPANDADGDGFIEMDDNCPEVYNPYQNDMDWDGIGDACDELPIPPE